MKTFISETEADGGDDLAEDLTGALGKALKMNWQSKAKYALLVTDAPCHGTKFHDMVEEDNYEGGVPN